MKTQTAQKNELIVLVMQQPNKGKVPVSRTEDGKICLMKYTEKKVFYKYGSEWLCEVIEVYENKLIVEPLLQTRSARQLNQEMETKLSDLKNKYSS